MNAIDIWNKVRTADGMDKILPSIITSCRIEGAGAGAKRICGTDNGPIEETILLIDDETMTFKYSIDNEDAPLPVSNYVGTVRVTDLRDGKSSFLWSADYEAKGMSDEEVKGMLEGVFAALLDSFAATAA